MEVIKQNRRKHNEENAFIYAVNKKIYKSYLKEKARRRCSAYEQ